MQEPAVQEIVRSLLRLPPDKLAEVHDFVLFLQDRYGRGADVSDLWSDEDVRDLTAASLAHAADAVWGDEPHDDPPR